MRLWIVNNYSVPPKLGGLVRHFYFSKFLMQMGHEVRIITGSQIHNTSTNFAEPGQLMTEKVMDGVPYTFVNTISYNKNNHRRILNMAQFSRRARTVMQRLLASGERPDVILASSPQPISARSALGFAKKEGIPFVFEVRDLWPQSIVDYGYVDHKPYLKPAIQMLYRLEHQLYRDSDACIFTMRGAADYVRDRGWNDVDLENLYHVNNGVDLAEFDQNLAEVHYADPDLDDPQTFKIVYMGSIRPIYRLDQILDAAKEIYASLPHVRFYLYGGGIELERLQARVRNEGIQNVVFKGRVSRTEIPSIVARADVNLIHYRLVDLVQYGTSNNKLFEYFAAGKPVFSTVKSAHSLITLHHCGVETADQEPDTLIRALREAMTWSPEERAEMGKNARRVVEDYDYAALTKKLEKILLGVIGQGPKAPSIEEDII